MTFCSTPSKAVHFLTDARVPARPTNTRDSAEMLNESQRSMLAAKFTCKGEEFQRAVVGKVKNGDRPMEAVWKVRAGHSPARPGGESAQGGGRYSVYTPATQQDYKRLSR